MVHDMSNIQKVLIDVSMLQSAQGKYLMLYSYILILTPHNPLPASTDL